MQGSATSEEHSKASQRHHLFGVERVNSHLFLSSCIVKLEMSQLQRAQDMEQQGDPLGV